MAIPTEWTEAMAVGVEQLDDDHRIILGVLNQLGSAIAEGEAPDVVASALMFFCDHAATHFRREELLMTRFGYPGLEEHRRHHRDFMSWAGQFRRIYVTETPGPVPAQMMAFPAGWWINHILTVDASYKEFFAAHAAEVTNALSTEDLFEVYGFDDADMMADDPLRMAEDAAIDPSGS